MMFPNKLVPFQDKIIKKSIYILKEIPDEGINVAELYEILKDKFEIVTEYQQALDLLYCLDKIYLNGEKLCLRK